MNALQVLDHFDRISDAPDAIPRLRRFILDLAVRGKLVEQDPNDEPASELLKRIQAEKARLLKDGKIGKQSLVRDDSEVELPFRVPELWEWTPATYPTFLISDLGKKIQTKDVLQAGKFPVVDQGKMFIRGYCNDSDRVIYVEGPVIIFGDHTRETKLVDFDFVVGADGVKILKPIQIVPAYYFLTLQWLPLDSRGYGRHFKLLRAMKIPLPPLAEQHRVVAKMNELMALCDRFEGAQAERESRRDKLAVASLHRLNNGADVDGFREQARFHLRHLPRLTTRPEHIQQLRQTILNLAVRGQLVLQDPNDEPASELLRRIRREKKRMTKEGTIKRLNPAPPIEAAEIPAQVPDSWIWVRLSDLMCGESQNGYSKKPDDALDGIPILRISAGTVRRDGIVAEEEHKLIGGVSAAQQEQYRLEPGDLLACRFNGNRGFVGRLSIYLGYLAIKPIYPDKLIRLRLLSQFVLPNLVRCFAESNVVRSDIESYCATTVGNWGISASNLKLVKFPLPPLAEQHRIVAKVEELMVLCDRLEAQLTTTQTESRRLLEAVLHEALKLRTGNDRSAHL